ncbi:DUF6883 domain-containing protein [Desulfoferrobacter suflitae]|uniref:DUF6883 domain-containing protein n=1 Tax=Desulfoferrobacter suflitae TaxID=2865782 RepID=UPI002164E60A|nr:DUF6883 domain-containing protein [Desulfoferrobacter suflitae]MCK8603175.1 hypothetical protein [Desulfoferrobacter suflitae]
MRLSRDALISTEKLTKYLLTPRKRNDKSKWLSQAGYIRDNWEILEDDLRNQILPRDALLTEKSPYGDLYEITGELMGPNGRSLAVCTIWMIERATNITKFITMYPDKGKR